MDLAIIEAIELKLSIKLPIPYPPVSEGRLVLIQATLERLAEIDQGIKDATNNSIATAIGGMAVSPARALHMHRSEGTRQVSILANLLMIDEFTNPYSLAIQYSLDL